MNTLVSKAKVAYQHLPPVARGAAASAYGYYLRWWRYGPETNRLVAEAIERESWTREQWDEWRSRRLGSLLHHAATRVPYYRDHWRRRRAAGDDADWTKLDAWPLLDKDTLRRDPKAFLVDEADPRKLFELTTSGTSGTLVTTWRSRATMRAWYALMEARTRMWYGVNRGDPWAILGGKVVTPASQKEPPFWVWNAGLHQLYLSSFHLAPENAGAYVEAMRRHRIRHLYGYASSMNALARAIREQGLEAPSLVVVVSNAEPLLDHQRALIGEVFGCPVRDSYGMSEIVAGASECAYGSLHLWPDAGVVEVLADGVDSPVSEGESGELVCTGLLNDTMPLIRYRVGDRGALVPSDQEACRCGRLLPRLAGVEGRVNDNLLTRDGRPIFSINPIFYGLPILEAQVVQVELDEVHLYVVPGEGFGTQTEQVLAERMRQRMADVRVRTRIVERIPREGNGKLRSIVNRVQDR